jgi:hypothetical protein
MNWINRIDHHLRELEAKKEASALKEKIAEIEECACDLHDAYFGNEFSRESLLRSEELLIEFICYLRRQN